MSHVTHMNESCHTYEHSNVPLTPAASLKLYMNQMTLYEQGEILDYPQVRCMCVMCVMCDSFACV